MFLCKQWILATGRFCNKGLLCSLRRIPHALTWSLFFVASQARPNPVVLGTCLPGSQSLLWENLASLPPSAYWWCGHGKCGIWKCSPCFFWWWRKCFQRPASWPPDFLCLICTWPFPELSASASPFPGLDISIHILLKGLVDAWLLRACVGPVLKSSFPLQRKIPVE